RRARHADPKPVFRRPELGGGSETIPRGGTRSPAVTPLSSALRRRRDNYNRAGPRLSSLLIETPLVHDDESARAQAAPAAAGQLHAQCRGPPNVDSSQMRPPCSSTICLAMSRPRPVPLTLTEGITFSRRL